MSIDKSWHKNPLPHRRLRRGMQGADVQRFQVGLNARLSHSPYKLRVKTDGVFGDKTLQAWTKVRWIIGMPEGHPPTPAAQLNTRQPWTRTSAAVKRAKARRSQPVPGSVVPRPKELFVSNVPNQSARTDSIQLIVLHDTEGGNVKGSADLRGVDSWFSNTASQASAHVTVDAEGNACQHVPDSRKAWACAAYNSKSLNIEQIGFMTQTKWPDAQLKVVAQYVAHWSQKYNIPLVHSTTHGVCQHKDLGVAGGNHGDCGDHYPFAKVLDMARALIA